MTTALPVLVLAGTAEARAVIGRLVADPRFAVTASLAGATPSPRPLPVPVISGGFGGAEGLARYCHDNNIAAIIDVTHPFARHISRNARNAAEAAGIVCIAYDRPAWPLETGWREFDDWTTMVAAVPANKRVFLAGGTASIDAFATRDDIFLWARALNVADYENDDRVTYINALPHAEPADERRLFEAHSIELLCCKNSGGPASSAKIEAARGLGIPVWMLARRAGAATTPQFQVFNHIEDVLKAVGGLVHLQNSR